MTILQDPATFVYLLSTPLYFFLTFVPFLGGEEYGWRYYLQPILLKQQVTWSALPLSIIPNGILFGFFLLAKEFRKGQAAAQ